jgi:hypothetical protein
MRDLIENPMDAIEEMNRNHNRNKIGLADFDRQTAKDMRTFKINF